MPDARALYGINNDQPATAIEWNEHVVVDGVAGKKVFPINLPPTAQTNPSFVVSYNAAGDPVYVDQTIGSTTNRKTITRSDMTVTETLPISSWV